VHDDDDVLDAARALVLDGGPRAAGIAAIARASGAPNGSLYHRFGSRDGLLAEAWLRALAHFQDPFVAAADAPDPLDAAASMAASVVRFARERPADARLLIDLRRRDLLDGDAPADVHQRLEAMNARVAAVVDDLFARLPAVPRSRVLIAVRDLPYGVVRARLGEGGLSERLEHEVARAARAVLAHSDEEDPR
jgi:AcrR family transcriptional regulator